MMSAPQTVQRVEGPNRTLRLIEARAAAYVFHPG